MLRIQVTYGGSRDNRSGVVMLQFVAPLSEAGSFSPLILYTKRQCFLSAIWESSDTQGNPVTCDEQFATAVYAGKNEDEEGQAILKFRTDVNSIFPDILNRLKMDCAEAVTGQGKVFTLLIMTMDDVPAA